MPIKVPNYNSFCITHFEAEKVYKCVESDQIVSPLVFHRDFQPPVESVRPEYQVLEEFLDNGNPIPNPYEEFFDESDRGTGRETSESLSLLS